MILGASFRQVKPPSTHPPKSAIFFKLKPPAPVPLLEKDGRKTRQTDSQRRVDSTLLYAAGMESKIRERKRKKNKIKENRIDETKIWEGIW